MAVTFNAEKMDNLLRVDNFILYNFIEALEKNPDDYSKSLEVVFNTFVLGDSVMEKKYGACAEESYYSKWRKTKESLAK